jgi:antitoxin VapB
MGNMRTPKAVVKRRRTLYIKNPTAHRLAEQVSKRLGTTLSDAVIVALEEKLQKTGQPIDRSRVDELCASFDGLPVLDSRSADEILGYDAFGIPE